MTEPIAPLPRSRADRWRMAARLVRDLVRVRPKPFLIDVSGAAVFVLCTVASSVDVLTEVRMARALEHLAQGRTTIAIAHRLSAAMRADRALVLENGRLVEDGPHATLVAAGGHYAALFESWVSSTATGT